MQNFTDSTSMAGKPRDDCKVRASIEAAVIPRKISILSHVRPCAVAVSDIPCLLPSENYFDARISTPHERASKSA